MLNQFEQGDELDAIENASDDSADFGLLELTTNQHNQQSEHLTYLAEQTALFRQQQQRRRRTETALAAILCSTLTGNVSRLFVQWGAGWLIAALGGCIAGCAVMASVSELSSDNSIVNKAKYLIPVGASLLAVNDYRDKQWQTWIGVQKYKEDIAEVTYGKRNLTQVGDESLRILIIIASILVLLLIIPKMFNKDENHLDL